MTGPGIWIQASRPKTLPAALAPVAMGIAIAWRDGVFDALPAIAAFVGAMLIQIATNFANDYFDGVKGTDTEDRLGPQRAVQAGLVTPATMKRAFILTFGLAAAVGAYLVWHAGWPIVVIGLWKSGMHAAALWALFWFFAIGAFVIWRIRLANAEQARLIEERNERRRAREARARRQESSKDEA